MMANTDFKPFAPPPIGAILAVTDWDHTGDILRQHFATATSKDVSMVAQIWRLSRPCGYPRQNLKLAS